MESQSLWIISFAFLINVSFGLDTKMFQLTMPNVRPYRVNVNNVLINSVLTVASIRYHLGFHQKKNNLN